MVSLFDRGDVQGVPRPWGPVGDTCGQGGQSEPGAPAVPLRSFCSKVAACLLVVNVESLLSYNRRLNDRPPLSKLNLAAIKFRVSHTISAPENGF